MTDMSKGKSKLKTKEQFIQDSINVHGDKFDYSLVNYIGTDRHVDIICKEHGVFSIKPRVFLRSNHGCQQCGMLSTADKNTLTMNNISQKIEKIYNDNYDLSSLKLIKNTNNISINCIHHGNLIFDKYRFLSGRGCKLCRQDWGFKKSQFVNKYSHDNCIFYTIECFNELERFIKIGITGKELKERFRDNLPYDYDVLNIKFGKADVIWDKENEIKKLIKPYKITPQLRFSGYTECFSHECLNFI